MQKYPKPNLKIHTHLFYANYLDEPREYKSSEKLKIDEAWESGTNFNKKAGRRSITITDENSPLRKYSGNQLFK